MLGSTSLVDNGPDVEITCTYSYAGPYVPTSGLGLSMKAGPEGKLTSIIDIDTPEDGADPVIFNGVSYIIIDLKHCFTDIIITLLQM